MIDKLLIPAARFTASTWVRLIVLVVLTGIVGVTPAQAVILKGKITNPQSDSISVSFNTSRIAYFPTQYDAALAKDGTFTLTFNVTADEYIQAEIHHSNHVAEVILEDQDSLYLTVNAGHFDSTMKYKGRGANVQNFVAAHTLARGRMNQYSMRLKESLSENTTDFLKKINAARAEETEYLKAHKKDLPPRFVRYWSAYYEYYNYFFLQQYPQVHEILKNRRFTDTIPDSNYRVIAPMPLAFNDSFLELPPYLLYLTGAIELKMKAAGYRYFQKDTVKARPFRDSLFRRVYKELPPGSAEFYVAQSIYAGVRSQPLADTRMLFDEFKKHFPASTSIPLIDKQIAIIELLEPGHPAPELEFTDSTGARIPLSALRGKVVYLEFWASFCRQCVSEMLREQKVKELEKNNPVVFAYVSLSDNAAEERELISKYKIDGLFMTAKGGWNSAEARQYGVQSLPAYFLIDQEGRFAVRNPSSPNQSTQQVLEIGRLLK